MHLAFRALSILLCMAIGTACAAAERSVVVQEIGMAEVAATLDEGLQTRCLPPRAKTMSLESWQAHALLSCLEMDRGAGAVDAGLHDHPVYERLFDPGTPAWLEQGRADVAAFERRLYRVLEAGLSQGYNIVPVALWPEFDPDKTVIYGHSDWRHARQLVALLQTRGLTPRVTPVLKKSAFLYHEDWGEPSQPLPRLKSGERVVDQLEYDLFLEFDRAEQVTRFAELVTRYAKKDEEDEPGLLHGAWWQPFYRTMSARGGAHQLTVLLLSFRGYRTNLISLPEDAARKLAALRDMDPEWTVTQVEIWVNPGFYRNMLGDYR